MFRTSSGISVKGIEKTMENQKKLERLENFEGVAGPVLTIVMDGVGIAPAGPTNAVSRAFTSTLDKLMATRPMVTLKAHGTAVGLPTDDDMGNSEVGHNALGSGQVLHQPYTAEKAKLVLREMADSLVMDLVEKGLVTDQIVVTIGYDIENLTDPERRKKYRGDIVKDHYGRQIPKHSHGTQNLGRHTSSTKLILDATSELFDRIANRDLLIRRLNITANHVIDEASAPKQEAQFEQLDFFTDYAAREAEQKKEEAERERERKMQRAVLTIRKKYGKNAILKGMNLEEGATAKDRNEQIGGHKA